MKVIQRLIIFLSLVLLMAGCVTLTQRARLAAASPPVRQLAHPFTIREGEQLLLEDEGLTVEFTQVVEDSRCPAKLDCAVRGNAKINILLRHGEGKNQHIELDTDPDLNYTRATTEDGEYQVELIELELLADPSDKPTLDQRYIATLTVTRANPAIGDVEAQLAMPFTLKPGQWAELANTAPTLDVQFHSLVQDDRCPRLATCGATAEARVQLALRRSGVTVPKLLELRLGGVSSKSKVRYADYEFELKKLLPERESDKQIAPRDYRVTIVVTNIMAQPTDTPTATEVPTVTPTPTIQATPIRTTDKTLNAALNAPFTLSVGQTAQITDEDFALTFRSADDNSGCFTEDDCSSMQFSGTLATQKGDQKQLMTIMAGFNDDAPFTTDFAGYTISLSSVKKLPDGSIIATFVVADTLVLQATAQPAPPPQFVDACPFISKFDAAALLQETVQEQAVANLRFGPASTENAASQGLCGYVSTAYTADQELDLALPHLTVAVQADHAVVAAKLTGGDASELLQIADLIHAANPENDAIDPNILEAMIAAGDGEGVLEQFDENAQGSQTLHTELIENLQNKALWVWQTYENGHFAALIAYDGSEFSLVAALLGQEADEAAIQAKATILIQQAVPTPTPMSVATPINGPGCDTISQADAAAILGEPVRDEPMPVDEVCGFDSIAHKPPSTNDLAGESLYFAGAGIFQRSKTEAYLLSLAAGLRKENPNGASLSYQKFQDLLKEGQIEDAFNLLPELVEGSPTIEAKLLDNLGKSAVWLWAPTDDELVATILVLDQTDQLISIFAQLNPERDQADVLTQMTIVAHKVVARAQNDQTEPTVTPIATPTPVAEDFEAGCPALSQADAIAIVGKPVLSGWDGSATLCGYGGLAQKLGDTYDMLALDSTYGVAAGVLSDQSTSQLLLNIVETLHEDNAQDDPTVYPRLKTWLMAGMNEDVIAQLDLSVDNSSTWTGGGISDLGKFGVWLSKTTEAGDQLILLLAPRLDGGTVFVIAQTKSARTEQLLPEAMIKVADKLMR
ncbi:MAG: hypothetical protein NT075_17015 [Chloroflexi bacterium]|nr:hypothetical protein [Chloroflexota bacterium]